MDVRLGYKQTEAGLIPNDWGVNRLGELIQGSRTIRYGIVQPGNFDAMGCFMLRSQDYSKGWAGPDRMHKVSTQLEYQYKNARIHTNDLIITIVGAGIGQVVVVPDWLNGAILSRSTARIAVDGDKAALGFVKAFLESDVGKRQLLDCQKEGAQPVVSCPDLSKFFVVTPPHAEQQAIATALRDADALMDALEQLLTKKRQIKQGAMQELLTGQRRLPGFAPSRRYKVSNVGMIPEDWACQKIGSIVDLLTGFPFSSVGYSEAGIRLLRGSNVKRGVLDWSEDLIAYWPTVTPDLKKYLLKSADIVIAMDGSLVGRSFASLSDDDIPALLLQRVARIRTETISQAYLRTWVCSPQFTEHCDAVKTTTAIPHICPADIRSFEIAIPPTKAEQDSISLILSDMEAEIITLEAKLSKARHVKQGMMQELLTGRIRLI